MSPPPQRWPPIGARKRRDPGPQCLLAIFPEQRCCCSSERCTTACTAVSPLAAVPAGVQLGTLEAPPLRHRLGSTACPRKRTTPLRTATCPAAQAAVEDAVARHQGSRRPPGCRAPGYGTAMPQTQVVGCWGCPPPPAEWMRSCSGRPTMRVHPCHGWLLRRRPLEAPGRWGSSSLGERTSGGDRRHSCPGHRGSGSCCSSALAGPHSGAARWRAHAHAWQRTGHPASPCQPPSC
mmetsp:Transcript_24916/g.64675  ORF Transcript_24916/g.64675 Transcript_24916/m.64675 type:complete len:235 (-) Transcript_24916:2041-2745(-)